MKNLSRKGFILFCTVFFNAALNVFASDVTVPASLVSLAMAGTNNYTFTDTNSGKSIVVKVTAAPTSSDSADVFNFIDGNVHCAIGNPSINGDGNWVDVGEGVHFTASLVSSSTGVFTNTIRFRIAQIGIRPQGNFAWVSSLGTNTFSGGSGETLFSLDAATVPLGGTNYSGDFSVSLGRCQLSDISLGGTGLVFNATFSSVLVSASEQVTAEDVAVPSLAFVNSANVVAAANFGGSDLVQDGVSFTGWNSTSNPMTNGFGDCTLTLSAPSGNLSGATFGDALFGSFIWADNQNEEAVQIDGLTASKKYSIYYLAGDSRSLTFNMLMTLQASNSVDSASATGTMAWGAATGNDYVYLPVTVSNATSVKATMTKNGSSSGVGMSGVLVVEEKSNVVYYDQIYVTEYQGGKIRMYTTNGADSIVASGLGQPTGIAFDAAGTLYYASSISNIVQTISSNGAITTFCSSNLSSPYGMAFNTAGQLYVADYGVSKVTRIEPDGSSSYFATNSGGIYHLALDNSENIYVASHFDSKITKYSPAGVESDFLTSGIYRPDGLAFDKEGNLFIAGYVGDVIFKATPAAALSNFATNYVNGPSGMAFDSEGNLYVANFDEGTITRFTTNGVGSVFATGLIAPNSIAIRSAVAVAPVIVTNPTDQSTCAGGFVSFSASASGAPSPTVQWQSGDGTTFTNIPGATSTTYTFSPTVANNGMQFRAVFSNVATNATTTAAVLSVNGNIAATISPLPSIVCSGSTGNQAIGPAGMSSYSWTISNGTITGSANAQLVTYTAGAAGEVALALEAGNGSCTAGITNYISIAAVPTSIVVTASSNVCADTGGHSATVTATGMIDTTDDRLGTITAQGENLSGGEVARNAFDNNSNTKWLDFANVNPSTRSSWIQYQYAHGAQHIVTQYTITSANDGPQRDPSDWELLGSNDGLNWTTLDTRTNESFASRFLKQTYSFSNSTAYNIYRLQIDRVYSSSDALQLAEIELLESPSFTYGWSLTNAANNGATNQQTLLYSVGSTGPVGLTVSVGNGSCTTTITTNIPVVPIPGGGIFVSGTMCPNSTNTATGPAGVASYAWTISNGSIISATNVQTITFVAGSTGGVQLGMLVGNVSGCYSGDSTTATIVPLADPTITLSASTVYAGSTTNYASGANGASSYSWSITNGVITSATNVQTVTYTAGSSGDVGLFLVAGNSSGCTVTGFASATITSAPVVIGPQATSWLTNYSGQYARLYKTKLDQTNGVSSITWSNGGGVQTLPVYAGIHEVYSSTNWVYVRASGLAAHVMGPWYLDVNKTQLFPNYPKNQKSLYRIPAVPTISSNKTLTSVNAIGIFVDGVAMFDDEDSFFWNGTTETNQGTGYWYRDAYVNENPSFDPNNAHQEQSGVYHYHVNPPALRYVLGDNILFNPTSKTYSENTTNANLKHSPILGWMRDGLPLYGPYGYSNATNPASGVRRMVSGFVLRDGQNGTDNISATGRTGLPAWAARAYNTTTNHTGPNVTGQYARGHYMEDYAYLGDLGKTQGVDFDLNEYNCRYCVTPEFPGGTYAYFVNITAAGVPGFPYNIGRSFYASPTGGAVTTISETVVTNFIGTTNLPSKFNVPTQNGGTVTLTWSALEGGSYKVEASTDFPSWSVIASNIAPQLMTASFTNALTGVRLYREVRTNVAPYDNTGSTIFSTLASAPGGSATRGSTVTIMITLPSNPPNPPTDATLGSVTLAGTISGTALSHPTTGTVQATFVIPTNAPTGLQNINVNFTPNPAYTLTNAFTIQ